MCYFVIVVSCYVCVCLSSLLLCCVDEAFVVLVVAMRVSVHCVVLCCTDPSRIVLPCLVFSCIVL